LRSGQNVHSSGKTSQTIIEKDLNTQKDRKPLTTVPILYNVILYKDGNPEDTVGKSLATLERMTLPSDPRKLTVSALIAEAAAAGDTEQILASLTPAQLSALGRAALADELKDAIRKKIKTARIDY